MTKGGLMKALGFAALILLLCASWAFSNDHPMKQIVATWTNAAPVIDGKLTDPAWAGANEIGGFAVLNASDRKPEAATFVKVLTDGKALYFGFRCVEPQMDKLQARKLDRDTDVWSDDSIEVIIDPTNGRERVYHLIANAAGCVYDAEGHVADSGHVNENPAWNGNWEVMTSRGNGEWYAEWRIPFETMGIAPDRTPCLGLNLARARVGVGDQFSSWSPSDDLFTEPALLGELLVPSGSSGSCSVLFPRLMLTGQWPQILDFDVANHSAKPLHLRYTYSLSGGREVSGESDPFTVGPGALRKMQFPLNPTDTGSHRLSLKMEDADTGQPLYNCIRQFEVRPEIAIQESLYQLYQKRASAVVSVSVRPSLVNGAVLKITLLKDGAKTPVAEKMLRPPFANRIPVDFDLSKQPKGTYYIKAQVVRGPDTGSSAQSRPMPYNPRPKVGFNKDGFLVVDGKPYFPIGMYTLQDGKGTNHDRVLQEAHDAGFNTTVLYAYTVDTVTPLLDAAARHGIKAFVYPTIPFSVRKEPLTDAQAVADVKARVDHPAVLGWYLVDEPEGIGKSSVAMARDLYQLVKQADTEHPCSVVIMSPKAGADYCLCQDVIWTDPYPVPGSPAKRVADVVKGCVDAMTDGKPVWVVPQAFDWSVWNKGKITGEHRPTDAEERCMTYLALVHGAKGVIYWAHTASRYYIEDYPSHWAYMKRLAGELRDLSPILLTPNAKRSVRVSPTNASIDTMVKEVGGQVYLFAVNRDAAACSASFSADGITAKRQVKVLFEGRNIQAVGGVWEDDFKPLEVHVYRLGAK